jgi:hypothetical protein
MDWWEIKEDEREGDGEKVWGKSWGKSRWEDDCMVTREKVVLATSFGGMVTWSHTQLEFDNRPTLSQRNYMSLP